MLSHNTVCIWTVLGGKCLTCGGTHFVNSLLSCDIVAAFQHNQLLFAAAVILVITFILLHLFLLGKMKFAKKLLKIIYSIPSVVIAAFSTLVFLFVRNIPMFVNIYKIIKHMIQNSTLF